MSILGWKASADESGLWEYDLLAPSPRAFQGCHDVERLRNSGDHGMAVQSAKLVVTGTTRLRFVRIRRVDTSETRQLATSLRDPMRDYTSSWRYVVFVGEKWDSTQKAAMAVGICLEKIAPTIFKGDLKMPLVNMWAKKAEFIEAGEYSIVTNERSLKDALATPVSKHLQFPSHNRVYITDVWAAYEMGSHATSILQATL